MTRQKKADDERSLMNVTWVYICPCFCGAFWLWCWRKRRKRTMNRQRYQIGRTFCRSFCFWCRDFAADCVWDGRLRETPCRRWWADSWRSFQCRVCATCWLALGLVPALLVANEPSRPCWPRVSSDTIRGLWRAIWACESGVCSWNLAYLSPSRRAKTRRPCACTVHAWRWTPPDRPCRARLVCTIDCRFPCVGCTSLRWSGRSLRRIAFEKIVSSTPTCQLTKHNNKKNKHS